MLTKVIATGVGAVIAGVAAYQVTTNYLGDCGSSCSHDAAAEAALVSASAEGDSCCPLTGSKGAEILAVAETEAKSCATACSTEVACETVCTDEMKAACDKPCSETEAVVLEASLTTDAASCSAEKTACSSTEKVACSAGTDSDTGVEILMVATEEASACSAEKTACSAEKTACESKTECETEKLAAAESTVDNG